MSFAVLQADARDSSQVGGKAAALSRLAAHGFNPPEFFAITPEAFRHGRNGPVAAAGLAAELKAAVEELGPGPYAVRSSGRAEDGAEHSHAGQFDTVLNVSAKDVMIAAKQVWSSGFSETVETYRAVKSGGEAEAPAIIVQRMIMAKSSGVAFSADPVTGQRGRVVISAIVGFGDRLVSGEEDGENWAIDGDRRGADGAGLRCRPDGQSRQRKSRSWRDVRRRRSAARRTSNGPSTQTGCTSCRHARSRPSFCPRRAPTII